MHNSGNAALQRRAAMPQCYIWATCTTAAMPQHKLITSNALKGLKKALTGPKEALKGLKKALRGL